MTIYGVALLALCSLAGLAVGEALGFFLGVKANVGGVGFAMILLVALTDRMTRHGRFRPPSAGGVMFWNSMYIPIVVAMAAQQNVLGAIEGGPRALLAGTTGVVISFAIIPMIARLGRPPKPKDPA